MSRLFRFTRSLIPLLLMAALGCNSSKKPSELSSDSTHSSASPQPSPSTSVAPATGSGGDVALRIDPNKAWQYTKEIVAIGPRWDGGPGQQKMGEYIHNKLKNDQVEEDKFVADTPEGKFSMRNIIAKFPGTKDGIIDRKSVV